MILRKYFNILFVASFLIAISCRHENNELAHHHDEHTHEQTGNNNENAHAHSGEIILSAERVKDLGIKVSEIKGSTFAGIIEVSGQLSSSPLDQSIVSARSAGMVSLSAGISTGKHVNKGQILANVSARGMSGGDVNEANSIALDAAKRELDRLTPLAEEGIVTRRDYNAAKQRYEEAKAAVGASKGKIGSAAVASMSGTITELLVSEGQFVDAGQPIAIISGNSSITLRADLPERFASVIPNITGATFRTSYNPETFDIIDFQGTMADKPSLSNANGGYIPIYFNLTNNGNLIPGSFCTVFLRGAERSDVYSVPIEAVTEQQGIKFVYIREHDDAFRKQPVTIGNNDGFNVEILSGLKDGDEVVTSGTTFVRLAESSGVVPEGHKHNH